MDAFYASIEELDQPSLRGKPVVVGADPRGGRGRGVVSTANYEARRYGIHSAMPISRAYLLCPQAEFLPPRFDRYVALSTQIMQILQRFSPELEPLSIDEAFLDCTASVVALGPGLAIARAIKQAVHSETGLTASVGVAANKFVAKVASDLEKPDGLVLCAAGEEAAFLAALPIRKLWGVGPRTAERLQAAGIHTIGALASANPEALRCALKNQAPRLQALARGEDSRAVDSSRVRKSISEETTFVTDQLDPATVVQALRFTADQATRRLRKEGLQARTIHLKLRYSNFETLLRSHTFDEPIDTFETVFSCALQLLRRCADDQRAKRLVGVGLSSLTPRGQEKDGQLLLPTQEEKGNEVRRDELFDWMIARFGKHVSRASLIPPRKDD